MNTSNFHACSHSHCFEGLLELLQCAAEAASFGHCELTMSLLSECRNMYDEHTNLWGVKELTEYTRHVATAMLNNELFKECLTHFEKSDVDVDPADAQAIHIGLKMALTNPHSN